MVIMEYYKTVICVRSFVKSGHILVSSLPCEHSSTLRNVSSILFQLLRYQLKRQENEVSEKRQWVQFSIFSYFMFNNAPILYCFISIFKMYMVFYNILTKKCPDRHKNSRIYTCYTNISQILKKLFFLYFIKEKFNKNAKVEQLTKMLGRGIRLIVILPFECDTFSCSGLLWAFSVHIKRFLVRMRQEQPT